MRLLLTLIATVLRYSYVDNYPIVRAPRISHKPSYRPRKNTQPKVSNRHKKRSARDRKR